MPKATRSPDHELGAPRRERAASLCSRLWGELRGFPWEPKACLPSPTGGRERQAPAPSLLQNRYHFPEPGNLPDSQTPPLRNLPKLGDHGNLPGTSAKPFPRPTWPAADVKGVWVIV